MLPRLALLLVVAAGGRGLRTRETVERTVVVRTTGSDLQPAATGYIYKKKQDGEESVVEMGESEIMKRLSHFYEHPKEFPVLAPASDAPRAAPHAAPPAAPHDASEAPATGRERVIPVDEKDQDHVDGVADVDYKKIFSDYSPAYENNGYDDYLKSLKRFQGGLYHKYNGDSAEDDPGYGNDHRHGNRGAGHYHNAKFESFSVAGGSDTDRGSDDGHRDGFQHDHHEEKSKNYHDKEPDREFRKVYDNKKNYDDHGYFGKKGKAYPDPHKYYGTYETEYKYDGPYKSEHHADQLGPAGEPREGPGEEHRAARPAAGKSFGFDVTH